jgi:carbon monoxide dehydrogenase subunit G
VQATADDVWAALTDPDVLTRLTPYLRQIEADGDRWTWHLGRVPVLGIGIAPSFTEVMSFSEPTTNTFTHDPERPGERAGVDGDYHLTPSGSATALAIDVAITVDLPFPRVARPAVQTAMRGVVAAMGARFSANLIRHLETGPGVGS